MAIFGGTNSGVKKIFLSVLAALALAGCASDESIGEVHVFVFGFGYVTMKPREGYTVTAETKGAAVMTTGQTKDIMVGDQYSSVTAVPPKSLSTDLPFIVPQDSFGSDCSCR